MVLVVFFVEPAEQKTALAAGSLQSTILSEIVNSGFVRWIKIAFCCFCGEYPCKELLERMNDKWPHHWTQKTNLEYIKKIRKIAKRNG